MQKMPAVYAFLARAARARAADASDVRAGVRVKRALRRAEQIS
jgi:hypothetical protein